MTVKLQKIHELNFLTDHINKGVFRLTVQLVTNVGLLTDGIVDPTFCEHSRMDMKKAAHAPHVLKVSQTKKTQVEDSDIASNTWTQLISC